MPVPITQQGALSADVVAQINANFAQNLGVSTGNLVFVDPLNGYDGNSGQYPTNAFSTLQTGYNALREGKNDVLVLIGNGLTTATARVSAAFTWSKNAAHMMGVCSPGAIGRRARIAPNATDTAFANFFTISGSGCFFQNIQWFQGFNTGTTAEICLTVSGGRNVFNDCDIQGMGDTTGATDTGSRNLLITKTGENTFRRCSIGIDTVLRTVANYSVEFLGTTPAIPRNVFEDCIFSQWSSAATSGVLYVAAGAGVGIDRYQIFKRCIFFNDPKDGSYLASTGVVKCSTGQNGVFVIKDCTCVGFTGWGYDATSRGFVYLDGAGPVANATISETGIAVNPTA